MTISQVAKTISKTFWRKDQWQSKATEKFLFPMCNHLLDILDHFLELSIDSVTNLLKKISCIQNFVRHVRSLLGIKYTYSNRPHGKINCIQKLICLNRYKISNTVCLLLKQWSFAIKKVWDCVCLFGNKYYSICWSSNHFSVL